MKVVMLVMDLPGICGPKARVAAFTLTEVVVCVFIMMLLFGAIITSYIQTSYRAEWSGYSLAAQALGEDSSQPTANSQLPNSEISSTSMTGPQPLRHFLGWARELSAVSCRLSARRLGR